MDRPRPTTPIPEEVLRALPAQRGRDIPLPPSVQEDTRFEMYDTATTFAGISILDHPVVIPRHKQAVAMGSRPSASAPSLSVDERWEQIMLRHRARVDAFHSRQAKEVEERVVRMAAAVEAYWHRARDREQTQR